MPLLVVQNCMLPLSALTILTKTEWPAEVQCLFPLQKCPFDAIMIINLPKNLEKETTHRYGPNSFKLHRREIQWPL